MSKFNFDKVRENIVQVKKDLPRLMANDAQNYFLSAFKRQGWNGNNWQQVQRRIEGTNAYKYPAKKGLSRRTMPILQGTGRLRREVSNVAAAARITYSAFNFKVTLRIDNHMVPYAGYNNDGTKTIPMRRFMGDSPELRKILRRRVETYVDKVWKVAS